jgi:hypothetical protein
VCVYIYIYIYINGLSLKINSASEWILFADGNSVTIPSRNLEDFCSASNLVLSDTIKQFAADNLVLNLDKTNTMKFIAKDSKFLGLQIDNHINWKNHIEQMMLGRRYLSVTLTL